MFSRRKKYINNINEKLQKTNVIQHAAKKKTHTHTHTITMNGNRQ
jgi:hypothetical protein